MSVSGLTEMVNDDISNCRNMYNVSVLKFKNVGKVVHPK